MKVERLTPIEWSRFGGMAHQICFNEKYDPSMDRIDFALFAIEGETPLAYMTCKELDSKTIYLQYGGSFPSARGSSLSFSSYKAMLVELERTGYERAGTYIENTNVVMLKFALKAGWIITGIRTFEGSVLVELTKKFGETRSR